MHWDNLKRIPYNNKNSGHVEFTWKLVVERANNQKIEMLRAKMLLKIAMIICVIAVTSEFHKAAAECGEPRQEFSALQLEALAAHNEYRKKHNTPPLQLCSKLNKLAQDWADNLAKTNKLTHRPNNKFGENLYMGMVKKVTVRDAVKAWYDEVKHYNFEKPGFGSKTGHFTQVVWRASTDLGIGIAKRGKKTYFVANYNPPGNVQGQFPANVLPKK